MLDFQAWLNKRHPKEAETLNVFYDRSFQEIYTYAKEGLVAKMELLECNYIMQVGKGFAAFSLLQFNLVKFTVHSCNLASRS